VKYSTKNQNDTKSAKEVSPMRTELTTFARSTTVNQLRYGAKYASHGKHGIYS